MYDAVEGLGSLPRGHPRQEPLAYDVSTLSNRAKAPVGDAPAGFAPAPSAVGRTQGLFLFFAVMMGRVGGGRSEWTLMTSVFY